MTGARVRLIYQLADIIDRYWPIGEYHYWYPISADMEVFGFYRKKKKKCEKSIIILDCISIKWSLSPLLDNHIRGNAQKKKSQNIGSCISPKDLVSSGTNWQFKDSTFLKVRLSYLFLLQSRSRRYINTMIAPKYSVHRVLHPARIQKLCL